MCRLLFVNWTLSNINFTNAYFNIFEFVLQGTYGIGDSNIRNHSSKQKPLFRLFIVYSNFICTLITYYIIYISFWLTYDDLRILQVRTQYLVVTFQRMVVRIQYQIDIVIRTCHTVTNLISLDFLIGLASTTQCITHHPLRTPQSPSEHHDAFKAQLYEQLCIISCTLVK